MTGGSSNILGALGLAVVLAARRAATDVRRGTQSGGVALGREVVQRGDQLLAFVRMTLLHLDFLHFGVLEGIADLLSLSAVAADFGAQTGFLSNLLGDVKVLSHGTVDADGSESVASSTVVSGGVNVVAAVDSDGVSAIRVDTSSLRSPFELQFLGVFGDEDVLRTDNGHQSVGAVQSQRTSERTGDVDVIAFEFDVVDNGIGQVSNRSNDRKSDNLLELEVLVELGNETSVSGDFRVVLSKERSSSETSTDVHVSAFVERDGVGNEGVGAISKGGSLADAQIVSVFHEESVIGGRAVEVEALRFGIGGEERNGTGKVSHGVNSLLLTVGSHVVDDSGLSSRSGSGDLSSFLEFQFVVEFSQKVTGGSGESNIGIIRVGSREVHVSGEVTSDVDGSLGVMLVVLEGSDRTEEHVRGRCVGRSSSDGADFLELQFVVVLGNVTVAVSGVNGGDTNNVGGIRGTKVSIGGLDVSRNVNISFAIGGNSPDTVQVSAQSRCADGNGLKNLQIGSILDQKDVSVIARGEVRQQNTSGREGSLILTDGKSVSTAVGNDVNSISGTLGLRSSGGVQKHSGALLFEDLGLAVDIHVQSDLGFLGDVLAELEHLLAGFTFARAGRRARAGADIRTAGRAAVRRARGRRAG